MDTLILIIAAVVMVLIIGVVLVVVVRKEKRSAFIRTPMPGISKSSPNELYRSAGKHRGQITPEQQHQQFVQQQQGMIDHQNIHIAHMHLHRQSQKDQNPH